MPEATVDQIQRFANERIRVRAEQVRALINALRDDRVAIDDIYSALVRAQSGWTDARTDGPPRLATANDILAYNSFAASLLAIIDGESTNAQQPNSGADVSLLPGATTVLLTMCVRPVQG